ncbi:LysR substrate-binding domain-containing protein [Cupriavidus nantongensis]|uniref:LysR substrate-binding domain-containing protein n=1 Tax=Cupriavidus nantongensis TaxID=1796606 RepID=UPI00358E4ADE
MPAQAADKLLHHTTVPEPWPDWFATLGLPHRAMPGAGRASTSFSLLTQAALSGLGIALIPRCLIEAELASGALVVGASRAGAGQEGLLPVLSGAEAAHLPALRTFRGLGDGGGGPGAA